MAQISQMEKNEVFATKENERAQKEITNLDSRFFHYCFKPFHFVIISLDLVRVCYS